MNSIIYIISLVQDFSSNDFYSWNSINQAFKFSDHNFKLAFSYLLAPTGGFNPAGHSSTLT